MAGVDFPALLILFRRMTVAVITLLLRGPGQFGIDETRNVAKVHIARRIGRADAFEQQERQGAAFGLLVVAHMLDQRSAVAGQADRDRGLRP